MYGSVTRGGGFSRTAAARQRLPLLLEFFRRPDTPKVRDCVRYMGECISVVDGSTGSVDW